MRHGIIRSGRTVTYYGDDAQRAMTRMTASYCLDQKEADKLVSNASGRYARKFMVEELEKRGFKFDPKKIEKLNADSDAKEAKEKEEHAKRAKKRYASFPLVESKTSSKCAFCKKRIKASYHDGGPGERAHPECIRIK